MSTLEDLQIWQNALRDNKLLPAHQIEKAFTKYRLVTGEEIEHGYGWHLRDVNGVRTHEHGGSIFGFKSMAIYMPDLDVYILGLSNCDCISPTQTVKDIARLLVE